MNTRRPQAATTFATSARSRLSAEPARLGRGLRQPALAASLLLVCLGACKQGEGDRCQIDADCEEGLICCVTLASPTQGTCLPKERCRPSAADSGPFLDAMNDGQPPDGPGTADLGADTAAPDVSPPPDSAPPPDTAPNPDTAPSPDTSLPPDSAAATDTAPLPDSAA